MITKRTFVRVLKRDKTTFVSVSRSIWLIRLSGVSSVLPAASQSWSKAAFAKNKRGSRAQGGGVIRTLLPRLWKHRCFSTPAELPPGLRRGQESKRAAPGTGTAISAALQGASNPEYVLKALSGSLEMAGCYEQCVTWGYNTELHRVLLEQGLQFSGPSGVPVTHETSWPSCRVYLQ